MPSRPLTSIGPHVPSRMTTCYSSWLNIWLVFYFVSNYVPLCHLEPLSHPENLSGIRSRWRFFQALCTLCPCLAVRPHWSGRTFWSLRLRRRPGGMVSCSGCLSKSIRIRGKAQTIYGKPAEKTQMQPTKQGFAAATQDCRIGQVPAEVGSIFGAAPMLTCLALR